MQSLGLYRSFSSYLREVFGCRVQKISVDAGLTCPNRDGTVSYGGCIYCNERGSGTGAAKQAMSIREQLEMGKTRLAKRYKAKQFMAYFQSFSNTYGPPVMLRTLYEEALSVNDIVGLSLGTRPDCAPDEVLDFLEELSGKTMIWVEYGLQSSIDATLIRINRGHTVEAFLDAVSRTRARNLPICVHIILGLPGESREDMMETARFLACQDIQAVKIHLLYVIRGTVLEDWFRAGVFRCMNLDDYITIVAEFLSLLPPQFVIQRLTGDPHPKELAAPAWALEKQRNLRAIHDYMRSQGLYQGKFYRSFQGLRSTLA
jgi:uncharacterized protein